MKWAYLTLMSLFLLSTKLSTDYICTYIHMYIHSTHLQSTPYSVQIDA